MPLFFPDGVRNDEVVDPEKLADEFIRAANVAGQTDQWNWNLDALAALAYINGKDACSVVQSPGRTLCDLQSVQGAYPILPDAAGADANIWKLPFKRGLLPVGEGTPVGILQCQWTTEYPELVLIVMTCQYIRNLEGVDNDMDPTQPTVRAQVRIQLDGQVLPGSGPFANPLYDVRGTGYAPNTAALSNVFVGVIPAGTHVVQGVGGQSDNAEVHSEFDWQQDAPVQGVCIGARDLFVVRFARGDTLNG